MGDFDPHMPFTTSEALDAGLTVARLRTREFQGLLYGCYISSDVRVTDRTMALAALKVVPCAIGLSHRSAARALSGTVPHTPLVHLAVPEGGRSSVQGVRVHRYSAPPTMVQRGGLWVTAPAQTFVDLAGEFPLVDLVVLGDSLVRRAGVDPAALVDASADARGRGARSARRAAAYVRAGVDSAMETRSRLLMVLAGLPEPVVNYEIRGRDGLLLRRVDLALPQLKLAIEYDGRHHIAREEQWKADLLRREEFEAARWRFIVLVTDDIFVHPDHTVRRLTQAVRERGGAVGRPDQSWRRHFPGR